MSSSVIEREILELFTKLRGSANAYDRGVFIGFLFSLLPIFPLALVGCAMCVFHRAMYKAGKIGTLDYALVRRGLLFGTINSVLSILILATIICFASSYEWGQGLHRLPRFISTIFHLIQGIFIPGSTSRITTI